MYLEDVIIYSKTVAGHFDHVRELLSLLRTFSVTPRLTKCPFFDTEVSYLGHIIRPGQLLVDNRNFDAIKKALLPTN